MDWSYWEQIARIAPLGTTIIALIAATIAIASWRTQISIARKRAAIDMFLKTETDQGMLKAYRDYEAGLEALEKCQSAAEFEQKEPQKYLDVRVYLDVNELICIGINQRVFDQRVCYGFWGGILRTAVRRGRAVIYHARAPDDGGHTYDHILDVHARWSGRRWPWQRWRRS